MMLSESKQKQKPSDFFDEPIFDEHDSPVNVISNMQALTRQEYHANPSRLCRLKVTSSKNNSPEQTSAQSNIKQQQVPQANRIGMNSSQIRQKASQYRQHSTLAEENINDHDLSSYDYDFDHHQTLQSLNANLLSSQKSNFYVQKQKETAERKPRCHTLLPQQAQKYFRRDNKPVKSYIAQNSNASEMRMRSSRKENTTALIAHSEEPKYRSALNNQSNQNDGRTGGSAFNSQDDPAADNPNPNSFQLAKEHIFNEIERLNEAFQRTLGILPSQETSSKPQYIKPSILSILSPSSNPVTSPENTKQTESVFLPVYSGLGHPQHQLVDQSTIPKSPSFQSPQVPNSNHVETIAPPKKNPQHFSFNNFHSPALQTSQKINPSPNPMQQLQQITPTNRLSEHAQLTPNNISHRQSIDAMTSSEQKNFRLSQDNISRSQYTQKPGFEKQSSFKLQQLHANFVSQQFLAAGDSQSQQFTRGRSKKSIQSISNELDLHETEVLQGTFNTIDVRIDTQTIKTKHLIDRKLEYQQIESSISLDLIKAIFDCDATSLLEILQRIQSEERHHLINQIDQHGNTPLLLASKLAYSSQGYQKIIKLLLKADADPRIRDEAGWSCFEEVAGQQDSVLAGIILDNLIASKKWTLLNQKRQIDNMLADVPDFYMEMKWEFESNIIPFVSKFAPSDTFKIWKYGRSVRCDTTYAGLQKYRAKRRDQSLIFNCLNLDRKKALTKTPSDYEYLLILQKKENTVHFPLQDLDAEERQKVIEDLLSSSDNISGNLNIESSQICPSKSFFGSKSRQMVSNYSCEKYDLSLQYKYRLVKKTRIPFMDSFEDYFSHSQESISPVQSVLSPAKDGATTTDRKTYNNQQHNSTIQQSLKRPGSQPSLNEIRLMQSDSNNPFDISITEDKRSKPTQHTVLKQKKEELKKQTLGIFVSNDFPMKFSVFLPLLQLMSNANSLLANLYEVFKEPSLNEIIFQKGFPVKLQIPLSYSIYANITFQGFKTLNSLESESVSRLFHVPESAKYVNRKEKQNTMQKPKKRLMMANLYLS